ncbi:MAG: M56 family metallopeptidase [Gemmatimonadota bacterium]|nr:M56 family metallopeptidase [Gemmatimonadota bacterium]MDE2985624.1 M56 family metallopeptidase [Gemmatimonadota bacterium]
MIDILLQIGATKLALAIALAGTVWMVQRRVKRPASVHALWLMVLGAMLVPAVVPLRVLPEEGAVEIVGQSEVAGQPSVVPLRPPPEDVAGEVAGRSEVDPPVVVAEAEVSGDGMAPWGWLTQKRKPLAVLLWLLGSAGFLAWIVGRTVRFHRMLTGAARPAPQLQRLVAEIGGTLGLPRVPGVYTTDARLRPLVWWAGGRVRVLIPSVFLDELDERELRAVLAHELAHVRRRDYLVRGVELLACSAYWWNPVVWWAKRRMRSAEESSCDVLAVSASRLTRDRYARSLLRVVEIMSAGPIPRAPALASTADSSMDSRRLEKRLRTVLVPPPASPAPGRIRVAGSVALAFGVSLGLLYFTPGRGLSFDLPQSPAPAMIQDSAGIRIVEYAGMPDAAAPFRFAAEPRYRHGAGPGDHSFRRIHPGSLFPDGSAVVSDIGRQELVALGPDGRSHEVLAGPGKGTGDVDYVGATFALGPDRFLAVDMFLDRLTIFAGGSVERTVDFRQADGLHVLGIGAAGQLLMTTGAFWPGFEEEWLPGHMARFDMETGALDTVASYDYVSRPPPGLRWNPIGAVGRVAVAAGQFVYARSDRPQVAWHRPDGTVTQIVRWQAEPAPLTEEMLEGIEPGLRAGNQLANPGAAAADIDRMTNEDMATYRAVIGGSMPLFTIPFGDSEGRVWLPSYRPGNLTEGTPQYTVISGDGKWLGTVQAPPRFRLLDVGGELVLGVQMDENDVENVVVYELVER